MNYNEFTKEVKKGVEKIIRNQMYDGIVTIRKIIKNNSIEMKAISITHKGEYTTPTIYLDNYYNEYLKGKSIDDISEEVFKMYLYGKNNFAFNTDDFSDFNKIKDNIFYKLINYDMNLKLLKEIPHFKILDLAIVFFIMVSCDENGSATALIHNIHIENWQIQPEELKETAFKNTFEKYPASIRKMEDVISDLILSDIIGKNPDTGMVKEDILYGNSNYNKVETIIREEVENLKADKDINMYVLTNSIRTNGAACVIYPGILKQFAKEHDTDVYIIPSSIHEVILIPGKDISKVKLNQMISDVNRNEVDPVEILSNHVYVYQRADDEIHM